MKKQNDTISRAAALELIKEIGGCDHRTSTEKVGTMPVMNCTSR